MKIGLIYFFISYGCDVVFSDGDFYKEGVGGQGLYISPSRDLVIAWFSIGENNARAMARAIATSAMNLSHSTKSSHSK